MRHIMVMNAKGGSGKSTLATNLASLYALKEIPTALADYDPQGSSLQWLANRPSDRPPIAAITGYDPEARNDPPPDTRVLVIDAPARTHEKELRKLVGRAETILVPVLPSPIDIQAAANFIRELQELGRVERSEARIAVLANRVRENTLIFDELQGFLTDLGIPYLGALRETQNYIRAFQRGLGIFELPQYLAGPDWEQWQPIVDWLNSRDSLSA